MLNAVVCGVGILLLGFYFSGSKLTKIKANVKLTLDANYKVGGQRSARQVLILLLVPLVSRTLRYMLVVGLQVLACSLVATAIAMYYVATFGDEDAPLDFNQATYQSYLLASYIGHYACCAADTWASELGVLSKSEPRLITTGRRVPPGTNGGVSLLGTAASVAGGAFVGMLYYLSSLFSGSQQLHVVTLGAITGLLGSVLDSLLGATLQATWFNTKTHKICVESDAHSSQPGAEQLVCGRAVLTNEQVNAVSVVLTTVVSGLIAHHSGWFQ